MLLRFKYESSSMETRSRFGDIDSIMLKDAICYR